MLVAVNFLTVIISSNAIPLHLVVNSGEVGITCAGIQSIIACVAFFAGSKGSAYEKRKQYLSHKPNLNI